jgi:peptide/nickel transport system substrate-binding protein
MKCKRLLAMLLVLALALTTISCSKNPGNGKDDGVKEEDKYGGTFIWAQASDPNTLLYAWITSGWTNRMSSFINDKLFIVNADGSIVYRVCDSHKVSDDGLVYTFHIRDGAKWHDGTPVLASDIVWTNNVQYSDDWFMAVQTPLPGKWETVDDSTFTVTLDKPDPIFMNMVADILFPQPEHYWADVNHANFFSCDKATKPIGCGPFKFVEYKVGDYLKMEAFDDFWNGRPYLDEAYIKITGSADSTQVGFENGEISALTTTEVYYDEIKDNEKYQFLVGPSTNLCEIDFNGCRQYMSEDINKVKPLYTGDKAVREALCYAVPYDDIINKILRKACTRSYSVVPSDCQYFTEDGINKYEYDLDKANKVLDDAGYKDTDGDGIREWKDGSPITIAWSYSEAGGTNEQMSILMAEQCNKIGIASALKTEEQKTWVEGLLSPEKINLDNVTTEASIYYYGGYGNIAYDYKNMYSSSGGQCPYINWNTGEHYDKETLERMFPEDILENQAKLDELFKKMATMNNDDAKAAFQEIQRIVSNDMHSVIPIGTMERRIAFQSNIRGLDDALWFTNNNYLGFAMEKVWIKK